MNPVEAEIIALEEQLRVAELGPDAEFFEDMVADNAVMLSQDAQPLTKANIVDAHRSGHKPKFTRVEMNDLRVTDHGDVAVVTCKGLYEGSEFNGTLRFLRVWARRNNRWQIIAGSVLR